MMLFVADTMKSIVSLFLVLCLCQNSFASPVYSKRDANNNEVSMLVEYSLNDVAKQMKWINDHVVEVAFHALADTVLEMGGWIFGSALRTELVLMADKSRPTHLFFPKMENELEEMEHRIISTVVVDMWMDPSVMEEMDSLLVNVSDKVLKKVVREVIPELETLTGYYSDKHKRKLLFAKVLFEDIEKAVRSGEHLNAMYEKMKVQAKEKVAQQPKIEVSYVGREENEYNPTLEEIMSAISESTTFVEALVNKNFIEGVRKNFNMIFSENHFDRYVLGRAILQLASEKGKQEAVKRVYQEALAKVAFTVKDTKNWEKTEDLFDILNTKFEKDNNLYIKLSVLKSKIRKSTTFDADMLKIQILPL